MSEDTGRFGSGSHLMTVRQVIEEDKNFQNIVKIL